MGTAGEPFQASWQKDEVKLAKSLKDAVENDLMDEVGDLENSNFNTALEDALDKWFTEQGIEDESSRENIRSLVHLKIGIWFDEKSLQQAIAGAKRIHPSRVGKSYRPLSPAEQRTANRQSAPTAKFRGNPLWQP